MRTRVDCEFLPALRELERRLSVTDPGRVRILREPESDTYPVHGYGTRSKRPGLGHLTRSCQAALCSDNSSLCTLRSLSAADPAMSVTID